MSTETNLAQTVQQALAKQIKRSEKQIRSLTRAVSKVDDAEDLQVKGTLLKTYASQIDAHQTAVDLPDYRTDGATLHIKLDPAESVMVNAETYFHRYRRTKRGLATVEANLQQTKDDLVAQQARAAAFDPNDAAQCQALYTTLKDEGVIKAPPVKQEVVPAHPRHFYTTDHVLVEVGKNSYQNDHLTLTANKDYIWMHAGGEIAGSHVVVHSVHPSEETLRQAANLTAYYSKGRGAGHVPVDVAKVSQLRKPKGAKSGLVMIAGKWRTITVRPDPELAQKLRTDE
ncbi:NFACT RNA binding domain-containing protein [Lacticaseibacillus pabuli]|uniref:NFACT RNA binding domain-containing protein n=1 Tax=Lacticaseibacillus pabuli TaxID=3025672 RepID=A0ABY7WV04_9LACO|nr:NFACT RNA binding domain-containing protein [Lacticaseibacillus sp. KACC 23028]WDF82985.1 NFACT RNA binding domain-containing protein [Lacticaseibacillus sp. KACC 23028]